MNSQSNIIKFQQNFRIVLSFVNTFSIYWHIFGVEKFVPYSELVPKNDFQKKILDYAINGGILYSGNGFINTFTPDRNVRCIFLLSYENSIIRVQPINILLKQTIIFLK